MTKQERRRKLIIKGVIRTALFSLPIVLGIGVNCVYRQAVARGEVAAIQVKIDQLREEYLPSSITENKED